MQTAQPSLLLAVVLSGLFGCFREERFSAAPGDRAEPKQLAGYLVRHLAPEDTSYFWSLTGEAGSVGTAGADPLGPPDCHLLVVGLGPPFSGVRHYALLRVDLTALPTVEPGDRVWLELFCAGYYGDGPAAFWPGYLDEEWWQDCPTDSTGWSPADPTSWRATPDHLPPHTIWSANGHGQPAVGQWYRLDITVVVHLWQENYLQNYGLLLGSDYVACDNHWTVFYSSRYSDPSLRPRLVVEDYE